MALMENELHKLHLRLEALEGDVKELPEHLKPSAKVIQHSDVKTPEPVEPVVAEPLPVEGEPLAETEEAK